MDCKCLKNPLNVYRGTTSSNLFLKALVSILVPETGFIFLNL